MGVSGTRADSLTALSLPIVGTDRSLVSTGGNLRRVDYKRMHGGFRTRKTAIVKPVASDFNTWLNQNSATLTDNNDALSIAYGNGVTSGTLVASRYRSLPAGEWDVIIGTMRLWTVKEFLLGGLILYESATGKVEMMAHGHGNGDSGLQDSRFTNSSTFLTDRRQSFEYQNPCYFRARKFGTFYRFYTSPDGVSWAEFTNRIDMNNFFTTAPDKWGFGIQPANNGSTNATGMRMDIFDWSEASYTDIYPGLGSDENVDGLGDRTSRITVTTDATLSSGSISNLVDDNFSNQMVFNAGQSGRQITFQFSESKIVRGGWFYQNAAPGSGFDHGTWKWQGSNNGSSFTDISSTFLLDGSTSGRLQGDLTANVTPYTYYRLQQTAGVTRNDSQFREMQFNLMKG
jgi:hypothetical protein